MMDILISIIVPIYNAEKYIDKCLESLLNQTHQSVEIILINDGSTDQSLIISLKYAEKDDRIKVIQQENRGVSAARNRGLDIAKGEYVTFIDCDDYIEPTFLEDALSEIKRIKAELFVSGYYEEWYKDGQWIKRDVYRCRDKVYNILSFLQALRIEYPAMALYGPCFKVYSKKILDKYEIRFPLDMVLSEDTYFNYEYLKYCNTIVTSQNNYYHYVRINNNSLTQKYHSDYYEINIKIVNKFKELKDVHKEIENYIIGTEYVFRMMDCLSNAFIYIQYEGYKKRLKLIREIANSYYIKNDEYNNKLLDIKKRFILRMLRLKQLKLIQILIYIRYAKYRRTMKINGNVRNILLIRNE